MARNLKETKQRVPLIGRDLRLLRRQGSHGVVLGYWGARLGPLRGVKLRGARPCPRHWLLHITGNFNSPLQSKSKSCL